MKLSSIALAFTSLIAVVTSAAVEEDQVDTSNFTPTEEKPFNLRIEYSIRDKQTSKHEIVPLVNGESANLDYRFYNGEDYEVSIVGVGGQLTDPQTGAHVGNITATQLGPVVVQPGEFANFTHIIAIDLSPQTYLLVPAIYIFQENQLAVLGSRNQLISVEDPQISIFNPKLLILELLLLATVAGAGYFLYTTFGYKYIYGTQPKKVSSSASKSTKASASASASGSKTIDESWLPESHLKIKKTKKAN